MKKYLNTKTKLTLLIIFLLLPVILAISPAKAEDQGCCELESELSGKSFFNSNQSDCESYNESDGYAATFHAGQVESADKTSCIAKPADLGATLPKFTNPIDNPTLAVSIPGFLGFRSIKCETTTSGEKIGEECFVPWLADYMTAIYRYGIGVLLIFAVIIMMVAGTMWITAGGNDKLISTAKDWIKGSLFGIVIALSSYAILNIINPALTELSPIKLTSIGKEDLSIMALAETPTNDVSSGTIKSKGQECFLQTFGSSESEVKKNTVNVTMFGLNLPVHKLAKDAFEKVNKELEGKLGSYQIRKADTWTFVWRENVNNRSKLSLHSFGVAIDVNWTTNPNYRSKERPCKGDHPAILINAFKNNGFRWGGDYRSVCDSMHFEWLGPCQQ